jgi:hypothetical protein
LTTQPTDISIFYTSGLRGQLDRLPRWFNQISSLRGQSQFSLLVDLGQTCEAGQWICQATAGRGMLVAMDAMGYDAFHIGPLDMLYQYPHLVQQIQQIIVTPFAAGPWSANLTRQGLQVQIINGKNLPNPAATLAETSQSTVNFTLALGLDLHAEVKALAGGCLLLQGAASNTAQLGRVDIRLAAQPAYSEGAAPEILDWQVLALRHDLPPNPTLAGVVDFVRSEARAAEQKQRQ